jgi:ribosomal protein S18 acetylase RimI-like enzyme
MHIIDFKAAHDSDIHWCLEIYMDAMQPLVAELLPEWNVQRLKCSFEQSFKLEEVKIIFDQNKRVGWIQEQNHVDKVVLGQIYVHADFRGGGIGTAAMKLFLAKAEKQKLPCELWVMKNNPARQFYLRLDFKIVEENETKYRMIRTA